MSFRFEYNASSFDRKLAVLLRGWHLTMFCAAAAAEARIYADHPLSSSHPQSTQLQQVRKTSNSSSRNSPRMDGVEVPATLALTHRLKHDKSILVVALSDQCIFAGTQAGEILVFSLDTFERIADIHGHTGSVLGLCLSDDESLLFSTASDRLINVWDTKTFRRLYCLFSTYDVGDIFCVSFSSKLQVLYLGLQNTAIQWYNLGSRSAHSAPSLKDHPLWRENHPFYDSPGPGGIRTPRPAEDEIRARDATGGTALQIPLDNIQHFAHYGYVYCMLLATDIFSGAADQEVLITGGGDGAINVWKVTAAGDGVPERMFQLDDDREEGQSVLSICVDGTFLYSGRSRGEVNVWDLETKQLVRSLRSHEDSVMSVCVGGGFLFSASVTGSVRVSLYADSLRGRTDNIRNTIGNSKSPPRFSRTRVRPSHQRLLSIRARRCMSPVAVTTPSPSGMLAIVLQLHKLRREPRMVSGQPAVTCAYL